MAEKPAAEKPATSKWTPRRLALPAALVSLLMPGFGHLLIGQTVRAIVWVVAFVGFGLAVGRRPLEIFILLAVIAVDAFVLGVTTKPAVADRDEGAPEKEDAWKPLR